VINFVDIFPVEFCRVGITMNKSSLVLALLTILLWSFLGFFTSKLTHVPPFLQVGITLTIAGMVGAVRIRAWKVPLRTFLVGTGGIFGNIFFYYSAFQMAPVIEANLINYLWPLLIVLLSPLFLQGYHLRIHHLAGALLGLIGTWLVLSGGHLQIQAQYLPGYISAALAGLIWACYSLETKRLPPFSSGAVGGFCLTAGLLSLGVYFSQNTDPALWPNLSQSDWLYLTLMGIGPCAVAYFMWDAAIKRGDPRIIGSLTYLTPLTSTLVLVLLGGNVLSTTALLAMLFIISGAVIGSLDMFSWLKGRFTFSSKLSAKNARQ
jgi:drug/metabolite transporter (DMT)-like permease